MKNIVKKRWKALLKKTSQNPFMGTEAAHDYWYDQGWNACVRKALSSGKVPSLKKAKKKKPEDWAKEDGWNAAIVAIEGERK